MVLSNTRKKRIKKTQTRKVSILEHQQVRRASHQLRLRAKQQDRTYTKNWKIQKGGNGTLQMDGYIFVYDDKEGRIECITTDNKNLCFSIDFDKKGKEIGIAIGYFPKCSANKDLPESSGTLIMLKAILQYIMQHPDISLYTKIVIDDNSHKEIQSFEDGKLYKARLMDMYYVSSGCTWYSSLAPMFLSRVIDDTQYQKGRMFILSKSWKSFLSDISTSGKIYSITNTDKKYYFETILSDYKINIDDGAYTVFNKIRTNRTHSILFYKFMDTILDAFGVLSLYGRNWMIPLRNGKILCPRGDHEVLTCKNEKGWMIPESLFTYVSSEEYNNIKESLQIPEGKDIEFPEFVNPVYRQERVSNPEEYNEAEINNNYLAFITGKKDAVWISHEHE